MSKVYFSKIESYSKTAEINKAVLTLFNKIQSEEKIIDFSKQLPLKVHFGEDKCNTFIESKNYEELIDYLKKNSKAKNTPDTPNVFFTETNVLYLGQRTKKDTHIAVAKKHGFTQLPIIIADGEIGENYSEIKIENPPAKHFNSCKIGKVISDSEQLIIIAHFKGHVMAGFGGAIKQLGMGCAARGGKLAMHSNSKPVLNPIKCKKCYTCAQNCPTSACIIKAIVPHVDYSKCIGCAKCIAVCPYGAMNINWMSTLPGAFEEKLAEYAYAAQKGKKVLYFSFAFNITKDCDCVGKAQKPIAKDIGVLASTDPVALDRACLDLLRKNENKKVFNGEHALEHAEKLGLGTRKYELIKV